MNQASSRLLISGRIVSVTRLLLAKRLPGFCENASHKKMLLLLGIEVLHRDARQLSTNLQVQLGMGKCLRLSRVHALAARSPKRQVALGGL
jgi:hypothetical protein